MATQYGNRKAQKNRMYSSAGARAAAEAKDKGPKPQTENIPTAEQVEKAHRNSDRDSRKEAQHHTLGPAPFQASPGDHKHDGSDSALILEGVTIPAAPATYTQAWGTAVGAALAKLCVRIT